MEWWGKQSIRGTGSTNWSSENLVPLIFWIIYLDGIRWRRRGRKVVNMKE